MNKMRPALTVLLVLITFIILKDTIVHLLANTESFLRHDNRIELCETTYKAKIEELEKTIFEYERSTNSLKIYEGSSYILAKIALRDIYDIYDYVIVNTSSKVNEGDVVLNEHGLVGLVSETSKTTAKVSLLTGKQKISVKVGENYGILSEYDRATGEFLIHNIDNYKVVNVEDQVTTSGYQTIRGGIPIGKVTSVVTRGVEKVVRVKPYVDFDNLNYLMIEAR